MSETTVDARGQACPKPLILTKQALAQLDVGGQMTVLIDDETSKDNVCRFLEDNGAQAACTVDGGLFTIRVSKLTEAAPHTSAAAAPHAILIKNDQMGFGPEELGQILIKAFINTIGEASPLPGTIVFYNNGIHLTVEGSPVIESLGELESRGVTILVCGTCMAYHEKKEQLKVGTISNMYDILQALTTAGHVIVP